jgi:ABC-2 type transport system ATP-binding protein
VQKQPIDRRTGKIRPVSSQNSQEYVHDEAALREKRATLHQGSSRQELLLLDEPLARLDPLARREFLRTLLDATVETGLTVLLSSHIIGDLERVCDYLIILSASYVQLVGDLQEIGQTHKRLIGPRQHVDAMAHVHTVIEQSQTERQTTLLVRANGPIFDPSWEVQGVSLEDIVLAYLGRQAGEQLAASSSAHKGMEVVQ